MKRIFTGRHITAILVLFFGVVFAVNFAMAHYASSTFGGVVVENSYVASQHFNRWLDEAAREAKLGWSVEIERGLDNRLVVRTEGVPAIAVVQADVRHPLGRQPDRIMEFERVSPERLISRDPLPAGRWIVRIKVDTGSRRYRTQTSVS